jgi:hypothetical protein
VVELEAEMTDDDWKDELGTIGSALRRIAHALEEMNELGLRCYTQEVRADSMAGLVWHPDHVSGQLYKDSAEYIEHRRLLRGILAGREHVAR